MKKITSLFFYCPTKNIQSVDYQDYLTAHQDLEEPASEHTKVSCGKTEDFLISNACNTA
jgi:hypothetical protein